MAPTDKFKTGERSDQTFIIRQSKNSYEHRDNQATAMSVDYTGNWVLLAGRRQLALQRLGQDDGTLRRYYRNSKYEVSAAEFAICPNRQEFCAIATSQHIDIVTWGAAEPRQFYTLRGHTRYITDIDWHGQNPNLLVSCSIDTFSHIWDLREPRKPSLSLSAVCMSGATQVGFNRVSGNLLAAAHDGDLRIWDIRKGTCPTHYITAHLNRVHGINWSHRRETCLATASQDGTVKYFDINNPRRAEKIITTSSPVWRARYTPIGNGLVSIVVPHLGRGDNSLLLWSNSKQTDPICSFVGHTDVILDFAWRPNRNNSTEIELVTWSRDRTLRVWKIDNLMLKMCESTQEEESLFENTVEIRHVSPLKFQPIEQSISMQQPDNTKLVSVPIDSDVLRVTSISSSPRPSYRKEDTLLSVARSLTDQPTCSLHHELSLLNTNIPHVEVDSLDAINRFASFKISAGGHFAVLHVTFPMEYPCPNVGPDFTFCKGTTLHEHLLTLLLKVLKTNAIQRVKKSRTCLEQCLRAVVAAMKKSIGTDNKCHLRLQSPRLEGALSSGALQDACIPFPRTSGVKFNSTGILVTFTQVLITKRLTLRNHITPRTLSAISGGGLLGNVMVPRVLYTQRDANASFYLQDRMSSKHPKNRSTQKTSCSMPIVYVYDVKRLVHLNRQMACEFSLGKRDIINSCRINRQVCESHGRYDLIPIWLLAENIASPNIPNGKDYELLFYNDPYKKILLETLIMHFAVAGDLQMAVMLACLFHKYPSAIPHVDSIYDGAHCKLPIQLTTNVSPYHTVLPLDLKTALHIRLATTNASMQLKQLRSNSWSDSLDWIDIKLFQADNYSCSLIRRARMSLFDNFKRVYADILLGWHLLVKRALILKHTSHTQDQPQGVEFVTECHGCNKAKRTFACGPCQRPVLYCALCYLPVKGAAIACLACGHAGHVQHLLHWFETHDVCASGCGCNCLEQTSTLLEHAI